MLQNEVSFVEYNFGYMGHNELSSMWLFLMFSIYI